MINIRVKKGGENVIVQELPKSKNGDNCYLAYINIDGSTTIKSMHVKEMNQFVSGINHAQVVMYDGKKGFKKDSRKVDSSDDIEMVINWLGRKLGISMAKTYRYLSLDGEPTALISENVVSSAEEKFITMRDIRNELAILVENGEIHFDSWMERYTNLLKQKAYPNVDTAFENIAYDEQQVNDVIDMGYRLINLLPSKSSDKENIALQYGKMLFLDILVGQVDRTLGNYGFIHNEMTNIYSFSPLFDNATLRKPYTSNNVCMINNFMAERMSAFHALLKNENITQFAVDIVKIKHNLIYELVDICEKMLSNDQRDMLLANILLGIFMLEDILQAGT